MTRDEIIWELTQKLKEAKKDKEKVDNLEPWEYHCVQRENAGYCRGIEACIKWVGEW